MTAPTGNVWMDPDTGKPANPQNVQQDMGTGIPFNRKYGPGVRDTGMGSEVDRRAHRLDRDPDAVPAAPPAPAEGITQRKFGTIAQGGAPKPDGAAVTRALEDVNRTKIAVRDLGHESIDKKVSPEQRTHARRALEQLARNEFSRPDGPRKEIVSVLKRYDITADSFRPAPVDAGKED